MNSFSHYSFGAVMEWAFRDLAGIDTEGPGYRHIVIRPHPPTPGSNPDRAPIDWVRAEYGSIRGKIVTAWKRTGDGFDLTTTIPANTIADVYLPSQSADTVRESNQPLAVGTTVKALRQEGDRTVVQIESGTYHFTSKP